MNRHYLAGGSAMAVILCGLYATSASAQITPDQPKAPNVAATPATGAGPQPADNSGAPPPQAAPSGSVSEVVVTGQKRSERLINTPVVTEVFSAQTIARAGIQQPSDFLRLTPNVNFYSATSPGDFNINIRGQASVRNAEPAVALIIDGVPVASSAEFNSALFDIQQIEVLKGPQGAYYGRDASAGAILIESNPPSDTYNGQALVDYGNFNTWVAKAAIGGPIVDGVTFRAGIGYDKTDGPYTNVNTGSKIDRLEDLLGRVRVNWDVNERLKLDFRVSGGSGQGGAYPYTPDIGISPLSPTGTLLHGVPVTQVGSNIELANLPYVSDVQGRYRKDLFSTSMKADYSLPWAVFTSITAYSQTRELQSGKNIPYGDPFDPTTNFAIWTGIFGDKTQNYAINNYSIDQEFRLTSSGHSWFRWQVGFQYVNTRQDDVTDAELDGAVPPGLTGAGLLGYNGYTDGVRTAIGGGLNVPWPLKIQGLGTPYPTTAFNQTGFGGQDVAPFANVDFDITSQLTLRLAGRYDVERRSVTDTTPNLPNPFNGGITYNNCIVTLAETAAQCAEGENKTFSQFQPKITLDYKLPDFGTVYVSWGQSFKTGGFNEIGTRAAIVAAYEAVDPTQVSSVVVQDFYKKEVDTTSEIGFKTQQFGNRLFAEGAFFYTDISNAQNYLFDTVSNLQAIESIDKERIYGIDFDFNFRVTNELTVLGGVGWINSEITKLAALPTVVGNTPPYSAEYTANAAVQWTHPIADNLNIIARVDYELTGPTYFDIYNTPGTDRNPYGLVNVRAGLATDKYEVTLWSRNVTNTQYLADSFPVSTSIDALTRGIPRTFGIEVKGKF